MRWLARILAYDIAELLHRLGLVGAGAWWINHGPGQYLLCYALAPVIREMEQRRSSVTRTYGTWGTAQRVHWDTRNSRVTLGWAPDTQRGTT